MFDDPLAENRWAVRLLKLGVFAVAAMIVAWYALQFRAQLAVKPKPAGQQVAVLRNPHEKPLARRIAAEGIKQADAAVVSELTAELGTGDAVGRELAALALGQSGDDAAAAIDALIAALGDSNPAVRTQAAIALGRIGAEADKVAAALARSVADADPDFRSALFAALRRLDPSGVHRLLELLADVDPDIRRRAVIELGRASTSQPRCIESLRGCLVDADALVRAETFAALARHAELSLDDLTSGLRDEDVIVRSTACTLLERMGGAAARVVNELVDALARDGSRGAATALEKIAADAPEVIPELFAHLAPLLDSNQDDAAAEAALLMGALGPASEEVRDRLLAHVDSPRERIAVLAFSALQKTGLESRLRPPELIDALVEAGDSVRSLVLYDPSVRPPNPVAPDREDRFARGYGITDDDLAPLAGLRDLRLLDLRENPISDVGLAYVARLKRLEQLYLNRTNVTSAGLTHLAALTRLRRLSLAECEIDDAGLEQLKSLTSLEFLDLGRTKVTDAGMRSLAGLSRLKAIWFHGTQVTDAGLAHLSGLPELEDIGYSQTFTLRALARLKGLLAVRPPAQSVVDGDLALVADMPKLQELMLSGAGITDAGLEHVSRLSHLKLLGLNEAAITDTGLSHIAKLTQLEYLGLRKTAITDNGLKKLASLVKLKNLDVAETRTTEQGLLALQRALPNLQSYPAAPRRAYEVVGLKLDEQPDTAPPLP